VATLAACTPDGGGYYGDTAARLPDSETCHFQGLDVVCVQHRDGQPDVTTTDSPPMSTNPGDQVPDYQTMANNWTDKHLATTWPPAPEPGREQYLTPYEESQSDDFRPFAPLRMCADGTMWDPIKIHHCPDGNPGVVQWIHSDGTVVTVDASSPHGIRWNGGEVQ
jgi:hypothetical protein